MASCKSIGDEWYTVVARMRREREYDDSLNTLTMRVRRNIFSVEPKLEEEPLVDEAEIIRK